MIDWLHQENGTNEGTFTSVFFRDDENGQKLSVYVNSELIEYAECAEKCVEAFNSLTDSAIDEICKKIICYVKENDEFELPTLDHTLDILHDCWFVALYVDMVNKEDEVAYVVEGEGDWGEAFGFAIRNNHVTYVGADYLNHIENPW